eukprot:766684-Hanusia_phi.AAC.1
MAGGGGGEGGDVREAQGGGYGAINEKTCTGGRASEASLLMHATFGLDHYPNYLQRWRMSDVEALEEQLRAQLDKVGQEKEKLRQKLAASSSFPCRLATAPPLQEIWDPRFLELLDEDGRIRPARLSKVVTEELDGVYSFPLLHPAFCQQILQCNEDFAAFVREQGLEGTFHSERPAVLDLMRLG